MQENKGRSRSEGGWQRWRFILSLGALRRKVAGGSNSNSNNNNNSKKKWRKRRKEEFGIQSLSHMGGGLDHSAAKHKIAVRNRQPRRRKSRGVSSSSNNNNSDGSSVISINSDNLKGRSLGANETNSNRSNSNNSNTSVNADIVRAVITSDSSIKSNDADSNNNSSSSNLNNLNRSYSLKSGSSDGKNRKRDSFRRHSSVELEGTVSSSSNSNNNNNKDELTVLNFSSEEEELEVRERGDGDSCDDDDDNKTVLEIKSCLNSNVVFRRPSPLSVRSAPNNNNNNNKERFLTSIEHWTLANEGLKKSICDLSGASEVLGDHKFLSSSFWTSSNDSLDSICSGVVGRLLEDLNESASQVAKSKSNSLTSSSSGVESDVTLQRDAEDTEVVMDTVLELKVLEDVEDALEKVNVREMRKIFLFSAEKKVMVKKCELSELQIRPLRETRSFANIFLQNEIGGKNAFISQESLMVENQSSNRKVNNIGQEGSFVRALILKFDRISNSSSQACSVR